MHFGADAELCFALGRAAHAHRLRKWRGTPAEIAHLMPAFGFKLCPQGEDNLHQALRVLKLLTGLPENGPKLIYGGLFELFYAQDLHIDLRPFRAFFRRHIEATWQIGIGAEVLGEPVLAPMRYALPRRAGHWGMEEGDMRDLLIKRGVLQNRGLGQGSSLANHLSGIRLDFGGRAKQGRRNRAVLLRWA